MTVGPKAFDVRSPNEKLTPPGPMATSQGLDTASPTVSSPDTVTSTISTDGTGAPNPNLDDGTEQILYKAIMATNSISLAACVFTIVTYIFLRRKYPRLMSRTSLRLSIAMACSDAILHVSRITRWFHALALTNVLLLGCGPHRLFQHSGRFRLRICRRVDVHNNKLYVHVLCLRYCIQYPTRLCAQLRPKGQQANPVLCHTSNPHAPY